MPLALLALAIGTFGIGTTEFGMFGLLPDVAGDFAISIPTAGWLVTAYAVGVMLGAPAMTVLGTKVPYRRMLILLMGLFVAGSLISALAPGFGFLLVGRVVSACAHGAFFGIGAVAAAELVPPHKKASAISIMFAGLTIANVVGVPLGAYLAQTAGWRVTFFVIAAIGLIGLAGVVLFVPDIPKPAGVSLRNEVSVFRDPQVILAMVVTVLGFGGVFAATTYLAPMLTTVTGFADSSISWILIVFGVGLVVGNLIGGRFADRSLMRMLLSTLVGLAVVLGVFTFTAHGKIAAVVTIFLIGVLGFANVPPLQKRILDKASRAPTLASAANIGAFNLGNALAAWLGGLAIAGGLGYAAVSWVGAALSASAVLVAVLSAALERRRRTGQTAAPTTAG
ncbi:MFS transporter [Amycolatopsis sp. FDAARGOS 1241]|uniref:MFS transporter n=1 Tax=Amycolatopsis sp. FDAARGOS 1241 TaxID=2778070 RepID=UPI001950DDA9|nr:MFS transporter [Amycolatopsis sp. FDAARGOS 1241]QRP47941.1 MFS transporter [Amycolatopsis sp. FDAARGOS 1241]